MISALAFSVVHAFRISRTLCADEPLFPVFDQPNARAVGLCAPGFVINSSADSCRKRESAAV